MNNSNHIPFNKPCVEGNEIKYILKAIELGKLGGDGYFCKKTERLIQNQTKAKKVMLTNSCTDALELSALLCDIGPKHEVIMPSFTFVSTANAFCLRGARPVFVDIRPDTLNIDESLLEEAITENTKAIIPVHYAGVSCEMDALLETANKYSLHVIEDAAQGLFCKYRDRYLGTLGDLGCYSFHETKSFVCGEGGAIAINRQDLIERAEIMREKGTNRTAFFNGKADKYTWVDIGSSFLPSELTSSFLFGQLQAWKKIVEKRKNIFDYYQRALAPLETQEGLINIGQIPEHCAVNYHLFHLIVKDKKTRDNLIEYLNDQGIVAVFHYVPLHSSPYARKLGIKITLPVTESISERIVRLPFYNCLTMDEKYRVVDAIYRFFGKQFNASQIQLNYDQTN